MRIAAFSVKILSPQSIVAVILSIEYSLGNALHSFGHTGVGAGGIGRSNGGSPILGEGSACELGLESAPVVRPDEQFLFELCKKKGSAFHP